MASISKEEQMNRLWQISYNYVNVPPGNKTEAYKQYYIQNGMEVPKKVDASAYNFFRKPEVQKQVELLREENRKELRGLREQNIALLQSIATSLGEKTSDRIAATKELNSMCGYNNININAEVDATVQIIDDIGI